MANSVQAEGDLGKSDAPVMLDSALAYAAQGLAVFPLHNPLPEGACSCGAADCAKKTGKHPRTVNGLKAATTDAGQIRRWWEGVARRQHWNRDGRGQRNPSHRCGRARG